MELCPPGLPKLGAPGTPDAPGGRGRARGARPPPLTAHSCGSGPFHTPLPPWGGLRGNHGRPRWGMVGTAGGRSPVCLS